MDVMLDIIMLLEVTDVILCQGRQNLMAERLLHNIQFTHLLSDLYISLISRLCLLGKIIITLSSD